MFIADTNTMEFSSFEQLKTEFDSTCNWLSQLGIRIENNRLTAYKKTLDTVITTWREQPKEIPEQLEIAFTNCLYEIGELTQLHAAFKSNTPDGIQDRIKLINKGNVSFSEDSPTTNTTSRNLSLIHI